MRDFYTSASTDLSTMLLLLTDYNSFVHFCIEEKTVETCKYVIVVRH